MNRLKELRKEKKQTQKEFAKKIGIPLRTLQSWENGESQIKPDKAQQLADYFGVSVGYLLGFGTLEEEMTRSNKEMLLRVRSEIDTLLSLGHLLSDHDIDVISQIMHNMSSRNSAYFSKMVEYNDDFIKQELESEFRNFYNKNPNFIETIKQDYADYLRRINDPEEIKKRDERMKLIESFQRQKSDQDTK